MMETLRGLIDKNLDKISRRLGVPEHAGTTEERLSIILWNLMDDQPAEGARQRLEAVITDVIGERWKNDVAKYIAVIDIKGKSSERTSLHMTACPQMYGATEQAALSTITGTGTKVRRPTTRAAGMDRKALCGISTVGLLLMLLLGALAALGALAFTKQSHFKDIRVLEGDVVYLETMKSSEYKETVVREILKNKDSDHLIEAFLLPCHDLTEHFTSLCFQSRNLHLNYRTFLLGEQPGNTPIYLLAGSNVTYHFLISTNISVAVQPEFFIIDNYDDYEAFIFGKMEGAKKALYRQELAVGSPQNPAQTEITFIPQKDGYYFMTGYAEAGITYQFNVTDYVQYLNVSDYIGHYPVCRFTSELSCLFTTDNVFLGTDTKYCLIAHVDRPYSEDPPSTHIQVHTKKRYDILVIPGVVAIVSGIALVTVSFVMVAASITKRRSRSLRKRGYLSIQ